MSSSSNKAYLRAVGLGVLAGARSVTPLELVVSDAAAHPERLENTPLAWLVSKPAMAGLLLSTVGEYFLDQLPFVPSRTSPLPLVGRVVAGALAGAVACLQARRSPIVGALLGGVGGLVGTFVTYEIRRRATTALNVPTAVAGLVEDALVVGLGRAVMRATE